jgi:hypothetical protein
MARKDDLKLLFNFMIELLKDEEQTKTETIETKKHETELLKETKEVQTKENVDSESAKHILDVMKRVEVLDKVRKPRTITPLSERDEEEIANLDKEIITKNGIEKNMKFAEKLKNALKDAKEFMVDLETKKPLVPSIPLHELNENEMKRLIKEEEKGKTNLSETKSVTKTEKTSRKRK